MDIPEPKYRWKNPHEWLAECLKGLDEEDLLAHCISLASKLEADDIQDLYQDAMSETGYFDPIS